MDGSQGLVAQARVLLHVVIISIYTSFVVICYRLIAGWLVLALARFILFIRPFAISSDTERVASFCGGNVRITDRLRQLKGSN